MNLEDMNFIAHTKTIVSIYPNPIEATLDFGPTPSGGKTVFRVDGAPKGEHRVLVVSDMFESILDYAQIQHVGQNLRTPRPESANNIARELVRQWTTGAGSGPGQQPGIMLIAGREPTNQELAHLQRTQSACFEWLVLAARGFEANHQWRNINEKHRIAGLWLGLKDKWINEVGTDMDKGACQFCYTPLNDARATVCHQCGREQGEKIAVAKPAPIVHVDEPFVTKAVPVIPLTPPLQSPAMAR